MACHSQGTPNASHPTHIHMQNLQLMPSYQEVLNRRVFGSFPLVDMHPNTLGRIPTHEPIIEWSGDGFSKEFLEEVKKQQSGGYFPTQTVVSCCQLGPLSAIYTTHCSPKACPKVHK